MDMELYWTVVAAVFAAIWTILAMVRERERQAIADTREIVTRLLALDQVGIDHPDVNQYLAGSALEDPSYFRDESRMQDASFFKSKAFMYAHLNLFDEILSVAAHGRVGFFAKAGLLAFGTPPMFEITDWEAFMRHKMAHPLCRSILDHEGAIFGGALQDFWKANRATIIGTAPDPFSW